MTYKELFQLEQQMIRERVDPGIAEAILKKLPEPTHDEERKEVIPHGRYDPR